MNSKILTKLQFQNLAWTLTSNSWPNFVLKVWTKVQLYDQTSASKSATNCCYPSSSTPATVTTSTSFELASSHTRVTSIKLTKQEWVSQLVTDKGKQWSDSGPIKILSEMEVAPPQKLVKLLTLLLTLLTLLTFLTLLMLTLLTQRYICPHKLLYRT